MIVLIIDDDTTVLMIIGAVIGSIDGTQTVQMTDSRAASDWLRENTPDLIFIDQDMPNLSGLDVLDTIQTMPHLTEVPVVMITADTSIQLRVEALERGCEDFLTKPIIVPELLARARNLLRLRAGHLLLTRQAVVLQQRVEEATALLREQARELANRLSRAVEFRDPETGLHLERMAEYSGLIARRLGYSAEESRMIQEAAPMHDVGKVGIPDAILNKEGRLTPDEIEIMRQHPTIGHAILKDSRHALIALAADIAHCHHERYDGNGYPQGLKGDAIPRAARIVAVADVFDALTRARPYKQPWAPQVARDYLLANRSTHFDPECVDALLAEWDAALSILGSRPDPVAPEDSRRPQTASEA